LIGALVVTHAMLRRLTSRLCIIKENDNKSSWR